MPSFSEINNPRAEAEALLGSDLRAIVLEPSPPAVTDDFFADDPANPPGDGPTIGPDGRGDQSWASWLDANPTHAEWAASRWLGGPRRLPSVPSDLTRTRIDLHRLAAYVVAPVRHAANGKFGLRYTHGGFGTPFFGDDRQVRVADGLLIDQRGDSIRSTAITTLAAAAEFLEGDIDPSTAAESDSPALGDTEAPLLVDSASAKFLGAWYGMAFAALEAVRADATSVDPSRPQLWPGHFDPAIELGDEDHRGSYGASPGDDSIDEPYLYASLWWPDRLDVDATDPFWNAPSFTGAILRVSDFPTDTDPVDVAANFWRSVRDHLD